MRKKILFISRDTGGCGFFRCEQPARFLNLANLCEAKVVLQKASPEDLLSSDLVIMQETGSVNASNIGKFLLDHNIPFLTEFDDFVHHVSPNNLFGFPAWNPATLYVSRAMDLSRRAFGMTVSTNQLAREYFPYNPRIYVIPNFLSKDKWDLPKIKRADDKIRIGWAGGNAHGDDLKMISKVLEKISKEYKGKVVVETLGMTRQELSGVFNLDSFGAHCPSCGYEGEIHHAPGESLQDYSTVLSSKGWDIAVAPVIDNAFGNCKSNLKVLEYSALGLPIVASPITPYVESAKSNAQVLFAENFSEWYNHLKELIENPEKRKSLGDQNREWIKGYWIEDRILDVWSVYEEVIRAAESSLGTKEDRLKKLNVLK